jgi:hypothetical protein
VASVFKLGLGFAFIKFPPPPRSQTFKYTATGSDLLSAVYRIIPKNTNMSVYLGGLRSIYSPANVGWSWVDGTPATNLYGCIDDVLRSSHPHWSCQHTHSPLHYQH